MATSDMGNSQTSASSASGATIDWAAAFQSPEFLSGLQTAIAGVTTSTPRLEQLEQLGDSIPSQPSTSAVSTSGNLPVAKGTFHAPTFATAEMVVSQSQIVPPSHPINPLTSSTPSTFPLSPRLSRPLTLPLVPRRRSVWVLVGPQSHLNSSRKSSPQNLLTYPSFSQRTWTIPSRTLPVLLLRIQPSCLYLDLRANVKLT